MKFNVKNVFVLTVPAGKQNAGSKYVKLSLVDANNRRNKGEHTEFDEDIVADYVEFYADAAPDGVDQFGAPKFKPSQLKDAKKPCPEDLLVINDANFEFYPFGKTMVAVDDNDQPRRTEGGRLITAEGCWVFAEMYYNDMKKCYDYIRKRDPITRGSQIMARYYKPLDQVQVAGAANGVVLPQGAEQEIPAPTGAPTGVPGAAPAV